MRGEPFGSVTRNGLLHEGNISGSIAIGHLDSGSKGDTITPKGDGMRGRWAMEFEHLSTIPEVSQTLADHTIKT